MSDYRLSAQSREEAGKGSSRRLRRLEGLVPAIVYGGKNKPKSIQLAHKDLKRALEEESFYSSVITLEIDGKEEPVILKALQRHPAKTVVLHADFQRASAGTVLKVNVPVHFLNETICTGVKMQGGVIHHDAVEIEVSCSPKDLPEFIEVDLAEVELDQVVHLSDLKAPKGVTFIALAHGSDLAVASINKAKGASAEPAADEAEGESEGDE
ncbi:MAG: 50S ribosomal protein L25/general stress protein Ctc [Pseudomonadota bacterium]|nr:50S ribosomal protein L25/general stress protein Ctc [Pseudomonadota bacterium]MEC8694414.1 50S ribosomal protein L25/general stress protein Ctc [Pseudomonadota bacterium]